MIVFENQGELDSRLITTIGVNVKPETKNPIGYFGTGLKYTIATLLRLGNEIEIQSGEASYRFATERTKIRGKDFELVVMYSAVQRLELGFTTDLGRNWQPWMCYRELWCNAMDERGMAVHQTGEKPRPKIGLTRVIVSGVEIEHAHATRGTFLLLDSVPLQVVAGVELHPGPGHGVFYRGIRVLELGKKSIYTYNILSPTMTLTEDRTAYAWSVNQIIVGALAKSENQQTIKKTLLARPEQLEANLDYDYVYGGESEIWKETARELVQKSPLDVSDSVRRKFAPSETRTCPHCNGSGKLPVGGEE